eukprot:9492443-Pyramimonas_sp.AAC.1
MERNSAQKRIEEQEAAQQSKREKLMERIAAKQAEREARHQQVAALKRLLLPGARVQDVAREAQTCAAVRQGGTGV